jgi:putative membrane protein
MNNTKRHQVFLVVIFLAVWIWSAINPNYPSDWLMENILVFIFIPIILLLAKYFKLSNLSYTLITAFLILHVIGSHFTYSEVPFGYLLQQWFNADRNMYDRLVHFSFGLLLSYPLREVLMRVSRMKGVWAYYFPIDIAAAFSALYELIEWGTVVVVSPEAGAAFLGTQGDIWDAQKDMLMAIIGSIVAMVITFIINLMFNKNLKKELRESLKIPEDDKPLGEIKLMKMISRK